MNNKNLSNDFYKLNVLNYVDADNFIEREEKIDVNKLNFIIENEIIFKDLLRDDKRIQFMLGNEYDPSAIFTMAKEYLNKSKNGIVKTVYKQKNGVGRYFAMGSLSLQSITRQIRQTIGEDHYMDIDMKNCHPNILLFICDNLKINCDILKKYCDDREEFFKDNNLTKAVGKQLMLAIINGGKSDYNKLENPSDEMIEFFDDEIPNIHNKICSKFKDLFKKHEQKRKDANKNFNNKASFMNHILCDIESKILEIISEFFGSNNYEVLCFDGIMLPIGDYDLKGCENAIYDKLKIKIQLDVKPFEDIFDLSGFTIPAYVEITEEKHNRYLSVKNKLKFYIKNNDINDNTLSIVFNEMVKDDLITTNEMGDGYMWMEKQRLWVEKDKDELMVEICNENNLILKCIRELKKETGVAILKLADTEKEQKKILKGILGQVDTINNKIQSTKGIRDIYTQAKNRFRDDKFKTDKINRKHDLLPIRNGKVLNLIDGTIRDREKTDLFSISCDVDFIPDIDITKKERDDLNKFVNQIGMEDEDYISYKQIKMGSYLSGANCRDIDINHGAGKNGKSTEVNALKLVLGDFCGFIGKDVIVFDKSAHRKKGGGGHTSHLVPINGKRLIITQELEENDIIDSEMVKKIASSDPIEGVRECFGKKTWTMLPFCKLAICSNKIPKFDTNDVAITDRLVFNPYKARFLNKISMEIEKEKGNYDETKYKYYETNNSLIEKYSFHNRTIDIYFSWLVAGCMEFYRTKDEGIKKPKIVRDYINEKTSENDIVGLWLEECCNVKTLADWDLLSNTDKKIYTTLSSKLYDNFSEWAIRNNQHKGFGKIDFNKRIETQFTKKRNDKGISFERVRLCDNAD